jgi:hypothetical protein
MENNIAIWTIGTSIVGMGVVFAVDTYVGYMDNRVKVKDIEWKRKRHQYRYGGGDGPLLTKKD